MNMHWVDWSLFLGLGGLLLTAAWRTKKYTVSVADFLAANRCAGKYVLGVADGIAGLCAITIVAMFEMYYKAGFTAVWWQTILLPATIIIAVSGWMQYRYRETRAMTMAQFFEIRYSRRFRVFSGLVAFVAGTVNFGIFPAVAGRFFQYYCGFPAYPVMVGGFAVDLTYAAIMFSMVGISLALTVMGGQIVVMVTDFVQGTFVNVLFVALTVYLLWTFDWEKIFEAAAMAPANASLLNPLHTGETENFNVTYFLILVFGTFLTFLAWQGNQGYFGAARTPHEARMGRVIGMLRPVVQTTPLVLLPIGAYTLLHHASFAAQAQRVQDVLQSVPTEQLRSQLTVTVAITEMLPIGLMGGFAAVMFAAFLSTHDTYLHSWGSIFIQDVVLPLRHMRRGDTTPLSPRAHLRLLRLSATGVAVFIFLFSLFFNQQQDIFMYFALTGTVYLGWAGTAIAGGLYWKRGTTAGVWVAAFLGIVLAVVGWHMTYFWGSFQSMAQSMSAGGWDTAAGWWPALNGAKCPITSQVLWFYTMLASALAYIVISLATGRGQVFNMDRLLHRGAYARRENGQSEELPPTGWRVFLLGREYTFGDRCLVLGSYAYSVIFFGIIIFGTLYALRFEISDQAWLVFWKYFCWVMLGIMMVLTVWLAVGGLRDLRALFRQLRLVKRDARDDGSVVGHRNLDEWDETGTNP
jgi:SSS family solute:Na+ symporter